MRADAGPTLCWLSGGALVAAILFLVASNIGQIAPDAVWLGLGGTGGERGQSLLLQYAFFPRLVVSLLAGAALGLSGVLFQQVLQNPLAASETLGVSAGAQLALTFGLLVAPVFQARHPEIFAVLGAFAAWGLIAAIAWRRREDPMTLILTGFVANFALGSVAMLMLMLNQEYLSSLFIWGAGSLAQSGWDGVSFLAPRLLVCGIVVALMVKPLLILGFGDQSARSLGVSLGLVRPLLLAIAVFLSASVVATVGVIGFVGLAAPHIARLAGAERLGARLAVAPVAGAVIVMAIDQAVQFLMGPQSTLIPTGAITALLGAPLLIFLLRRIPAVALEGVGRGMPGLAPTVRPRSATRSLLLALIFAFAVALAIAAFVGRTPEGFAIGFDIAGGAFDWRLPRVLAAAGAGLALGLAGCLVQRLFANAMASPEILGVGGGVAVGLIGALLLSPAAGYGMQLAGAIIGALGVMGIVLLLGGHRGFTPERLLLIGVAVTALLNAAVLLFLVIGDPRAGQVLAWLTGSTYRVTLDLALAITAIGLAGLAAAAPLARLLDILPLGHDVAKGLGVPVSVARLAILLIAALTTAAAALIIGPLSFVGLLAPHLAALAGLRRAAAQLFGSALLGAALVTFADWVGRIVFAPTETPAGITAVLIGTLAISLLLAAKRTAMRV